MDSSPGHLTSGNDDFGRECRASSRAAAENLPARPAHLPSNHSATPRTVLIQIIEGEIIPRLLLAHLDRTPDRLNARPRHDMKDDDNYEFLADLFLSGEDADIVARLEALIDQGMQRDEMYLGLLASIPRRLGGLWEKGLCTFDGMTRGLNRLDHVMQQLHIRERTNSQIR